jgi:hypothetical protein
LGPFYISRKSRTAFFRAAGEECALKSKAGLKETLYDRLARDYRLLGVQTEAGTRKSREVHPGSSSSQGISQEELARRLGVDPSTVIAWEAVTVRKPYRRFVELFEGYMGEV